MDYTLHILVMIAIYGVLTVSLDLLVGQTGLLSIAHAAFYGIGAYSCALMATVCRAPFVISMITAILVAALISLMIALPSLRLHDDYFVVATFGFQMITVSVFNNWMGLTHGALGVPNIPQPVIFGWHVDSEPEFLLLCGVFAGLAYVVVGRLASSPFGRVLRTIREDEVVAKAVGKNTLRFKVAAFVVSAALAALAGGLYAQYITYIDPTSFTIMESILVLSMVIIGGAGSKWGPVIGAVALVTLPEALRFIGLPGSVAANLRQIFYGALLVLVMIFRPRGLVGRYAFGW